MNKLESLQMTCDIFKTERDILKRQLADIEELSEERRMVLEKCWWEYDDYEDQFYCPTCHELKYDSWAVKVEDIKHADACRVLKLIAKEKV